MSTFCHKNSSYHNIVPQPYPTPKPIKKSNGLQPSATFDRRHYQQHGPLPLVGPGNGGGDDGNDGNDGNNQSPANKTMMAPKAKGCGGPKPCPAINKQLLDLHPFACQLPKWPRSPRGTRRQSQPQLDPAGPDNGGGNGRDDSDQGPANNAAVAHKSKQYRESKFHENFDDGPGKDTPQSNNKAVPDPKPPGPSAAAPESEEPSDAPRSPHSGEPDAEKVKQLQ